MEHKHAALLRMAADDADQEFECDNRTGQWNIDTVLLTPLNNWRPVPKPKKTVKRWLLVTPDGFTTNKLYPIEDDARLLGEGKIKLLWSETEFEVDDE